MPLTAVSTLLAGIACPILGAIADRYAARKLVTYVTAGLSIVFGTVFAFSSRHSPWQELLAVPSLSPPSVPASLLARSHD